MQIAMKYEWFFLIEIDFSAGHKEVKNAQFVGSYLS
jgi:hypothetical protein